MGRLFGQPALDLSLPWSTRTVSLLYGWRRFFTITGILIGYLSSRLAHHMQGMIDRSEIRDRAELARRLGVTWARVTQILDMTMLAPGIQEEVLFMEAVDGKEPMGERGLRTHG